MFSFQKRYFIATILLFLIEVLIALFVHDSIIRPYVGDVLVVVLIYTFVLSFFNFSVVKTAVGVLIFSFIVEFAQYFKLVNLLGLGNNTLARVVIGTTFAWEDLVAYFIGFLLILFVEKVSVFNL
ncbi:MAG: DUF2809 domain-containing protein [Cytophagales bacterium]|nr:DUF2809 domain-containing protein [Cytophagales bacterium]